MRAELGGVPVEAAGSEIECLWGGTCMAHVEIQGCTECAGEALQGCVGVLAEWVLFEGSARVLPLQSGGPVTGVEGAVSQREEVSRPSK